MIIRLAAASPAAPSSTAPSRMREHLLAQTYYLGLAALNTVQIAESLINRGLVKQAA